MHKKNDNEMWAILKRLWHEFPYRDQIKKGKSKPGSTILLRAYKDEVEGRNDINQIGPGRRTLDTKIKEWENEEFNAEKTFKDKPELRIYSNTISSLINSFFYGDFEIEKEFIDDQYLFAVEYTFYGFDDPKGEKVCLFAQMFIVIEIIKRRDGNLAFDIMKI